jgi:hypothetical protein
VQHQKINNKYPTGVRAMLEVMITTANAELIGALGFWNI